MSVLLYLIPIALALGLVRLIAFLWALRNGQFEDLDGTGSRILFDEEDQPARKKAPDHKSGDKPGDQ
jgi:cbb3-type cytochrome oxidase maturation protein